MTGQLVGLVVTVALPTALLRLGGLVPGTRVGPFRYSRAVMRTRSASGANAAALLATAQLGQLAADLVDPLSRSVLPTNLLAALVVGFLLVAVLAVARRSRTGNTVIAFVGLTVGLANAYLTHGAVGVGVTVAMLTLLLWVLGFSRGLLR